MNKPQRSDLYDGLTFYFLPRKRMVFLCTLLYNAFKFESAAVSSSFTVFLRDLRLNDGTIFPVKRKRGVGAYTLCESRNTKTGSWYGSA